MFVWKVGNQACYQPELVSGGQLIEGVDPMRCCEEQAASRNEAGPAGPQATDKARRIQELIGSEEAWWCMKGKWHVCTVSSKVDSPGHAAKDDRQGTELGS